MKATLIGVEKGVALYKCDKGHVFNMTIADPFNANGPAPIIQCIFTHGPIRYLAGDLS